MYGIELKTIFYEYQNKNHKMNTSMVSLSLWPLGANKTDFNIIIFQFDICRLLSIVRCDRYIFVFAKIACEKAILSKSDKFQYFRKIYEKI